MKLKTIEFDSSKQSISDLIEEIANTINESFKESKIDVFKDMIADTKVFAEWAKDYKDLNDLLYQHVIIAINNLKKVRSEELVLLSVKVLTDYYDLIYDVENILCNYSADICNHVKFLIKEVINRKSDKSFCKSTKEDLSKLSKEDLINMIIKEEEPKKDKN